MTPHLWAYFHIHLQEQGATDITKNRNRLTVLALWLARSKGYPLSITITHDSLGQSSDRRSAQLLDALIPHAYRWKNIHLGIPSWTFDLLQERNVPALESLALNMKGLRGPAKSFDILALRLPWARLTGLDLHLDATSLLTLDDCLTVLTQCVVLSKCTLNVSCAFNPSSILPEKLALPHLRHLYLTLQQSVEKKQLAETAESSLVLFLEQLRPPQLETLRLDWLIKRDEESDSHWSGVQTRFISVLGGLGHTLLSFSLSYLPVTESRLLGILADLPNVAHLQLRFSLADTEHDPITDVFLSALTRGLEASGPTPLPRLEAIHLQCTGALCTFGRIRQCILSRWSYDAVKSTVGSATTSLRSFHFISLSPIPNDVHEMSAIWSREGLDISIDRISVL